jgi:butyrate kinase
MDWDELQSALERARDEADRVKALGESLTARFIELLDAVKPGQDDPVLAALLGQEITETARRTGWSSLILNPGSTSTKAAVYSGTRLVAVSDVHLVPGEPDGVDERVRLIKDWFDRVGLSLSDVSGIAARGGFVGPIPTGTYRVNDDMVADLSRAPHRHASNMAVPMALRLGELVGAEVEITTTDPVSCDEVEAVHRITGSSSLQTDGTAAHYLNLRAICTMAAHLLDREPSSMHIIACHMGGGSSAMRMRDGRMVQVLAGIGALPSANRAGALPLKDVLRKLTDQTYTIEELKRDIVESGGGLFALAGTNDFKAFLTFFERGASREQREKMDLLLDFFAGRFAAGIMTLAASRHPIDAVLLTGGLAHSERFCERVISRLRLACPVARAPGTISTQALAAGLIRTSARSRSLKPYAEAREELRRRREGEDAILGRTIFDRPVLRRREGSPLTTIDELIDAAYSRGSLPTVAIVGGENEEALLAAKMANHEGAPRLARFLLIGPYARIAQLTWELEILVDDDNFTIVDTEDPVKAAITLLEAGVADTLMKGSITTALLLKGYLKSLKSRKTSNNLLLSHVAFFEIPGRAKLVALTDAAINPNPDLSSRLQILENALRALKLLGIRYPKVAVISATEKTSDRVTSSVDAEKIAHQMGARRDLLIEGPISIDLALSPESAREKGYPGRIKGDADLLLAPNIDVANAVYKAFTVTSKATVAASVVGGDVPLILTSRGDAARAKLASIALALYLAREEQNRRDR